MSEALHGVLFSDLVYSNMLVIIWQYLFKKIVSSVTYKHTFEESLRKKLRDIIRDVGCGTLDLGHKT